MKIVLLAAVALLAGSWLSGYFIVATNAFMQHPVGFHINAATKRAEMDDFLKVLTQNTAIIAYRRMLLRLVHEYQAGIAPGPAAAARSFRVLSTSVVLPRETPWVEAIQERIQAVSEYMPA